MITDDVLPFPQWIPKQIVDEYLARGIKGLFQWQHDLVTDAVLCRDNIVYSAPTSAGKTIVADLIALQVALKGQRVLFVLPYISIANEKLSELKKLWRKCDIEVCGMIGARTYASREWIAAVCTIEKANSLLNHAILDGTMDEIGLIVLDELHMVSDSSRGITLESVASKVIYWNQRQECDDHHIRLIGMSATIENMDKLAKWLTATAREISFRPIQLDEYICTNGIITNIDGSNTRKLEKEYQFSNDGDSSIGLCIEGVEQEKLTLIFCSSKVEVEKTALEIARVLDGIFRQSSSLSSSLLRKDELLLMKTCLEKNCRQMDPILMKTLPRAVAFHHAGLTSEERECIESAFREGVVRVLVATSTLCSGVNLPANRVIIKAQTRGPAAINSTTYKQMIGRAGRLGHTDRGESFLIVRKGELEDVMKLITMPTDRGNIIKRDPTKMILEGICSGLMKTMTDVQEFISCLLYLSSKHVENILTSLISNSLIEQKEGDTVNDIQLCGTQLGRAALASSLPPDAALFVFSDLQHASRAVALDTELHMLYLVTPVNVSVWQGCDWNHLHSIFISLDPIEKRVAKLIGANDRFFMNRLQGRHVDPSDRQLQLHLRFLSSLALFQVVNENPLEDVAGRFRISRGALQTLQQQSATYAAMIVAFCSRLGWNYMKSLLDAFATRLAFGIRPELTELVRIAGMDGSRARIFHENDISSISILAQCTQERVARILGLAVPFESSNEKDGKAEWLFGEERTTLEEAAEKLIDRATHALRERLREIGFIVDDGIAIRKIEKSSEEKEKKKHSIESTTTSSMHSTQQSVISMRSRLEEEEKEEAENRDETSNEGQKDDEEKEVTHLCTMDDIKDSGYESSMNTKNHLSSTPLQERLSRPSLSHSIIANDSVDLFSQSMEELHISTVQSPVAFPTPPSTSDPIDEVEMDDLETSLLRISVIEEDSFYHSLIQVENRPPVQRRSNAITPLPSEDSFFQSFVIPNKTHEQLASRAKRASLTALSVIQDVNNSFVPQFAMPSKSRTKEDIHNTSSDVFHSPIQKEAPSIAKRRREAIICSPATSSPPGKYGRNQNISSSSRQTTFAVNDVCSNRNTWKKFVQNSKKWKEIGMGLAMERGKSIAGVSLCTKDGIPMFIPLTENYFPGNVYEESSCPTSTPEQSISIDERMDELRLILSKCRTICYDALSISARLSTFDIDIFHPICILYLSFLSHPIDPSSLIHLAEKYEWEYNIKDLFKMNQRIQSAIQAYICARLYDDLQSMAVSLSTKASVALELKSIETISHVSNYGFLFDNESCTTMISSIRNKMDELEGDIIKIAKKKFNIDSAQQVAEVLFSHLSIPYPGTSSNAPKRHLATSKAILEQIAPSNPIVQKILLYRRLKHTINNCLTPLTRCIADNNLIHTTFDMKSSTGRMLSNQPNVQNVPKNEVIDGLSVRSLFVAREGNILLAADYCQLELRVLAHMSQDENLIEHLSKEDHDFFAALSLEWGFSRDCVKKVCYGIIYGMGAKAMSETTHTSIDDAAKLISSFFKSFPKVQTFISITKEKAVADGYVETMLKQRRATSTGGDQKDRSRDDRQNINYVIQGTASEIFKQALSNIYDSMHVYCGHIVMTVHDEVLVECPSEHVDTAIHSIRHCMQTVFPSFSVPLRVKICHGPNWGSLKE